MRLGFTSRVLRANEDVGRLGEPLHELGDALRVILSLTQRAHHGTQDATDDFCEEFWVERLSCSGRIGCGVWSGGPVGTGWRWRRRKDGLGGLKVKDKGCLYTETGTRHRASPGYKGQQALHHDEHELELTDTCVGHVCEK